jgi:hypothetical protein
MKKKKIVCVILALVMALVISAPISAGYGHCCDYVPAHIGCCDGIDHDIVIDDSCCADGYVGIEPFCIHPGVITSQDLHSFPANVWCVVHNRLALAVVYRHTVRTFCGVCSFEFRPPSVQYWIVTDCPPGC